MVLRKPIALLAGLAAFAGFGQIPTVSADGFYVGLIGGAALLSDSDLDNNLGVSAEVDLNPGFAVGGVGGFAFESGFRLELDGTYRTNSLGDLEVNGADTGDLPGDIDSFAVMTNAYYDVDTGSSFMPYFGAGLGVAFNSVDTRAFGASFDDSVTDIAYQAIAGLAVDLGDGFILGFEYRYFGTGENDFEDGAVQIGADYSSHNLLATFRYEFGS